MDNGTTELSLYERIGGHQVFENLCSHFYALITVDPILRPMYPEEDLKGAAKRLMMFLEQYWGGPNTYSEERGHPRLRMRHAGFHINQEAKDAWLRCMKSAVDEIQCDEATRAELWNYMVYAAETMVNQPN